MMREYRLTTRGLLALVLLVGFDAAVLIRAYQHGRWAGSAGAYVVGFGLLLAGFHLILLKLAIGIVAILKLPKRERLTARVSPTAMLGVYLLVLMIPILIILFLRPGSF